MKVGGDVEVGSIRVRGEGGVAIVRERRTGATNAVREVEVETLVLWRDVSASFHSPARYVKYFEVKNE